jgi:hypothetical protein
MDLDLNTVLLILIVLGLGYMIYNKKEDEKKIVVEKRPNYRRRRYERDAYPVYPYYGYGYRRWYW